MNRNALGAFALVAASAVATFAHACPQATTHRGPYWTLDAPARSPLGGQRIPQTELRSGYDISGCGPGFQGFAGDGPGGAIVWHRSNGAGFSVTTFPRTQGTDTVLMIRRPDGTFLFNDDDPVNGGLGSRIEINPAAEGRYLVWIGSLNANPTREEYVGMIESIGN